MILEMMAQKKISFFVLQSSMWTSWEIYSQNFFFHPSKIVGFFYVSMSRRVM